MREVQEKVGQGEKCRGREIRQAWHLGTEIKSHLVLSYGRGSCLHVLSEKYAGRGEPD